ncbi:MAG: hypothetical protein HC836_47140 [Richelia sp. RM2_1_2]|nr:hypothetical protein [Richelia sp. RM2_1_2]
MPPVSYCIDNNLVRFRGEVIRSLSALATDNEICQLPVEIRPKHKINIEVNSGSSLNTEGSGFIQISTQGIISFFSGNFEQRYIRLNKIQYII